jgi:hypothetical protein
MTKGSEQNYSAKETEHRREAALKRMLATPHKPHAQQKLSPAKRDSAKKKDAHKS